MYQLGHFLAEQKSILTSQQDMSLFGAEGKFEKLCKWKSKFKIANSILSKYHLRAVIRSQGSHYERDSWPLSFHGKRNENRAKKNLLTVQFSTH